MAHHLCSKSRPSQDMSSSTVMFAAIFEKLHLIFIAEAKKHLLALSETTKVILLISVTSFSGRLKAELFRKTYGTVFWCLCV